MKTDDLEERWRGHQKGATKQSTPDNFQRCWNVFGYSLLNDEWNQTCGHCKHSSLSDVMDAHLSQGWQETIEQGVSKWDSSPSLTLYQAPLTKLPLSGSALANQVLGEGSQCSE